MKLTPLVEIAGLCDGAHIAVRKDQPDGLEVSGICHDSRLVREGDLFACISGTVHDGHVYASDAMKQGAGALLVERHLDLDLPQLIVPNVREAVGYAASAVYGYPSTKLKVVGITGTAGKTTVAHALAETLEALGSSAGVLGTLEGNHTTPEAPDFQKALSDMHDRDNEWACVEVSSHGLDYGRVEGTEFAAAVFTNLSAEHLDFHLDMESYFLAKRRLFEKTNGVAVVAVVDQWGERLANELQEERRQELVVVKPSMVESPALDLAGSSFEWRGHKVNTPLLGLFNMFNLVVVAETLKGLGVGDEIVAHGLREVRPVKGRMEPLVVQGSDISVVIDYSHKPESLAQALKTVRTFSTGRVWVVFGAGGNRDSTKRPLMGQIASELADQLIVTSDNPRFEEPSEIAEQIVGGIKIKPGRSKVILDRAEAIHSAINRAESGDSILIAGKGHESYQIIGSERQPFDDLEVAKEALMVRVKAPLS